MNYLLISAVITALLKQSLSMFICHGPPDHNNEDLGRFADSSEVVLTGKVIGIEPLQFRTFFVRATIEVDCMYKRAGQGDVSQLITVEGVSTQYKSCLSVVKLYTRYLFFLTSTSDSSQYNIHHVETRRSGAIQLKRKTDLSAVLEVAYQSSFQPHGHMCYQNCVEVSEWSEWGHCEASCGKSVMKRNLQPPSGVKLRKRNYDCSNVEEKALCEVCPCHEPVLSTTDLYVLEKPIETYFVHEGCQSAEVVRNKWCVGLCEDMNSVNVPIRWGVETLRMICYNGTVVFHNVAIIEECGCVKQAYDEDEYINTLFGFR